MDELKPQLEDAHEKMFASDGVHWIPVRHHSPACAYYLLKLLELHQPDIVLIEGSVDFNVQLNMLGDPQTKAPIALYGGMGFYPMCETSPEWQALRWGLERKKTVRFIDLPLKHKAWRREQEETSQVSLLHEAHLQHSEFVQKLVKQTGCRSGDELWERWFELREFDSANEFFGSVFSYCTSARLTYTEEAIEDSADAHREAFMREQLRQYVEPDKTCFVITGGFHTFALLDWNASDQSITDDKAIARGRDDFEPSWLIRYSQDRLDANNGYSAGMPAPGFYERLFDLRLETGSAVRSRELILDILVSFSLSHVFTKPLNTAAKIAVCQQVMDLANLRGHHWPGLYDVLDGIQSALIKQEIVTHEPLMQQARLVLAGDRLGEVSAEQPPLPLVDELYQRLKKTRFKLENTTKATTKIPLYQNKGNARLALLYQCQFLEIGFANKVSGPDWIRGDRLHLRHEEWQYAWTPWVEAKLVDLSFDVADWQGLLTKHIKDKQAGLKEQGLVEYQQLFVNLVLMDSLSFAPGLWASFNVAVSDNTDCDELSQLLFLLLRLRQTETTVFEQYQAECADLVESAWQQLMYALPNINKRELDDGLRVLLQIQELTQEFESCLSEPWRQLWVSRLKWLLQHGELCPGLLFASKALLVEMGEGSAEKLFIEIERLFDVDDEVAYEALCAVIKVVPHWLKQSGTNSLLAMLNQLFGQWNEDRFIRALPELRFLFSHLDPSTIEQISSRLCQLNNWESAPDVFDTQVDEQQIMRVQALQQRLVKQLEEEGLEHWIKR